MGLKNRKMSVLFLCLEIGGLIATSILAGRAAVKASDKIKALEGGQASEITPLQKVEAVAADYIPAVSVGLLTIGIMVSSHVLNIRSQAAIAGACILIDQSYKKYRDKVREIYGSSADEKITDDIMAENANDVDISAQTLFANSCLTVDDNNGEEILFYDAYGERFFKSTLVNVITAEYHLNRNFTLGAGIPLNMFYELLGLEETDYGYAVGWIVCDDEIYWIDFNHRKTVINGHECCVIEMLYEPTAEYLNYC